MAVFTAEGVRKGFSVAWSAITGIPTTVLDIAGLGDPGATRLVYWNDISNQLDYLDPAVLLDYDNATSGLAATNYQDAIDELAASVDAIANDDSFGGYVASGGGSGIFSHVGWSVANISTGINEVTHNLGLASANDLAIAPALESTADDRSVMITSKTVNSFRIVTVDAGSGVVNVPTMFTAKRLV